MSGVSVEVDTRELENLREISREYPQMVRKATSSALNRTLTYVGAETKRQVKEEYAVTKSISKSVKKTRATPSKLTAIATYTDKPIPMFVFKHTVANNRFRSPVSVLIKRSNGMQTHNGSAPALFRGYGKKIMRRDSGQKNIRTAYTVSIPQMVANDDVYNVIAEKAEVYLLARLKHEIEYRTSRL